MMPVAVLATLVGSECYGRPTSWILAVDPLPPLRQPEPRRGREVVVPWCHLDKRDSAVVSRLTQGLGAGTARAGGRRGEAQVSSATSRPVPLRSGSPQDRDIDHRCGVLGEQALSRGPRPWPRSAGETCAATRCRRPSALIPTGGLCQASSTWGLGVARRMGSPGLIRRRRG